MVTTYVEKLHMCQERLGWKGRGDERADLWELERIEHEFICQGVYLYR